MQGRLLGIGESLSAAWQTFTRFVGLLIGVYLVYLVIAAGGGAIPFVGPVISLFLTPPLMGGMIIVGLKAIRGEAPEFGEMFGGFKDYWRWMGVYYLFTVIMLAAMIPAGIGVLIAWGLGLFKHTNVSSADIPAIAIIAIFGLASVILYIALAIRYMFAFYEVADGAEIMESFTKSAELTEDRRLQLIWIAIVLGLFSVLGVIGCGIGIILTGLLAYLAFMHIYVGLKGEQAEPILPQTPPSPA